MCLHKRRYGEFQRRMPTKAIADTASTGYDIQNLYLTAERKEDMNQVEQVLRERYYDVFAEEHYKLIDDFFNLNETRSWSRICNQVLMHKLIYFLANPHQYGNDFQQFAIPWFYNLLLRMRGVILRDIAKKTGIQYKYDHNPKTQGLYPFPKSLEAWTVKKITNKLYDIYYDKANHILNHVNNKKLLNNNAINTRG